MKTRKVLSSTLALMLSAFMGLGNLTPVFAEKVKGTEVNLPEKTKEARHFNGERTKAEGAQFISYKDTDLVRVSIVLEKTPTTRKFPTKGIAANKQAMKYRDSLQKEQGTVIQNIEKNVLDGEKMDVVWNLTLAANMVSANVPFGKIDAIKAQKGVKTVVIERKYEPAVASKESDDPNMATSGEMIGRESAYANGYTGAGSIVAIVDTGIDDDHQSFDAKAFEYSIGEYEKKTGNTVDLLEKDEVTAVYNQLNIARYRESVDAEGNDASFKYKGDIEKLYFSSKIPFAFNYADNDTDFNHDNDKEGEHGSHVAGIAAANSYIPDETSETGFANALKKVYTQGVAPDAQILAMKVFGKKGGAYDSDYMAAIEDAIILGADSVNLSLGSASAGFTSDTDSLYSDLLADLEKTDTVVSISMGNSYSFAQNSYIGVPYNHLEDVNMHTGGSPGSYTNAFTVASIDNSGTTAPYMDFGGKTIFYNESLVDENGIPYGNEALNTIAGEHEFVYLDSFGAEGDFDEIADVVNGKIAICNRGGEISFYIKANEAAKNGAIAVVIANNDEGTIFMNLTGYEYTIPAVTITQDDADHIKENAVKNATESGKTYYTGKITVGEDVKVEKGTNVPATMSDFSSWGVPGSLELKPEITAPGGNIYSVNGLEAGGKAYENMSGTSMAAPQIAGMSALVAQYIKENGLAEQEGITVRALTQSLLMGTAVPQIEDYYEDDNGGLIPAYFSVLKQGAGLANVGDAVSAKSYILMDESATRSAADGKVKVELGADPEKKGEYEYSFTVNNMKDTPASYMLDSEFFTQYIFMHDFKSGTYRLWMADFTEPLSSDVKYAVDGQETETITVPAHGSVKVTVSANVHADESNLFYAENGGYIEGYTYIKPVSNDAEGVIDDVEQSIPVLAFYGDWSDSSMYEKGNYVEDLYGRIEIIDTPYTYDSYVMSALANESEFVEYYANVPIVDGYLSTINPVDLDYAVTDGEAYPTPLYERMAVNSKSPLGYEVRLIRNAAAIAAFALDSDGEVIWVGEPEYDVSAPFYHERYGTWLEYGEDGLYYFGSLEEKFGDVGKTAGGLGVEEGNTFTFGIVAIPEYYNIDGKITASDIKKMINEDALGYGAYLATEFTVDDTAPEIISREVVEDGEGGYKLVVEAKDNQNLAGIVFLNTAQTDEEGNPYIFTQTATEVVPYDGTTPETVKFEVPIGKNSDITETMQCAVYDYASNEANVFDEKVMEALMLDPAETKAAAGTDVTFTAYNELLKPYNGSTLYWQVDGATSLGTSISDGVLTIGEDEKAEELTVYAVLLSKDNKYPVIPDAGTNAISVDEMEKGKDYTTMAMATVKVIPYCDITVNTTGKGTVDPAEGRVLKGKTFSLTVTPAEGNVVKVLVNGAETEVKDGKVEFTVEGDTSVVVEFTAIPEYRIILNAGEGGSASSSAETAKEGEKVTITVEPKEGYDAVVTVNGEAVDASSGSFDVTVTKDMDIKVTFVEKANETEVTMYRMYNPNSGEHFYTAKAAERDALIVVGWTYEGIGWIAPKESETPVYRLYNKNGGEHHYTLDAAERDALVAAGWNDEGIGWYNDDAKTVPVYREYNPNEFSCNHNYTTDKTENDTLIGFGWLDEGIAWYALRAK